ncbi:MAG: toxin-antitoxin system YwqK family antitoxin [Elusimicrobiaceae bacterium]|nr:toxin-antitoxin system YwqK family antitoxin [Elusimicrobiaceae bacterium]
MKERIICIVTPDSRSYFRAIPLAKEFLDKDKNLINKTGIIPDGEVEEFETSTKTIKHYKKGKLDGDLEIIDLNNGEVTFFEKYKDGVLTDLEDHTIHGTPILAIPQPQPTYDGTIVKINKATMSFYRDGKEVAEQTIAANGATLELLGDIPDGIVKEFDDNGQVRSEATYKDNKLDGEYLRYDEQGRLLTRENYREGLREGEATYFSYMANGFMHAKAYYKNSLLHGPWTSYFPNGETCVSANYQNGKLHGLRRVLYQNGQVDCEEHFDNGKLHGPRTLYFPEGKVWFQENYQNGRLHGERFSFFPNGQKHDCEFYTEGLLEGPRQIFAENGELISSEEYHWGSVVHNTERRSR